MHNKNSLPSQTNPSKAKIYCKHYKLKFLRSILLLLSLALVMICFKLLRFCLNLAKCCSHFSSFKICLSIKTQISPQKQLNNQCYTDISKKSILHCKPQVRRLSVKIIKLFLHSIFKISNVSFSSKHALCFQLNGSVHSVNSESK